MKISISFPVYTIDRLVVSQTLRSSRYTFVSCESSRLRGLAASTAVVQDLCTQTSTEWLKACLLRAAAEV